MRIVHVGNFGARAKGASLHGVAPKISNGLIRNGHFVFNFDDREAARASSIFGHRKLGVRGANQALLRLCDHFGPDLVIFGHADVISADTLRQIKDRHRGVKMLQWNVDPLFDDEKPGTAEIDNVRRINSKIDLVDGTFISTAGPMLKQFGRAGHMVGFLPNPVDSSIERGQNFLKADLEFDFLYAVGNGALVRHHCGRPCDVEELGRRLVTNLPELRFRFLGLADQPLATGVQYQTVLESAKMGLNLSRRNDVYLYSSDRMAHLVGNGLLTFIDRASGFGDLFTEQELAFYGSEEELFDKMRFFKVNDSERRRVAENGWRKYYKLFSCEIVARYLIDAVFGRVQPALHGWLG
jgi:hypothetical protein